MCERHYNDIDSSIIELRDFTFDILIEQNPRLHTQQFYNDSFSQTFLFLSGNFWDEVPFEQAQIMLSVSVSHVP